MTRSRYRFLGNDAPYFLTMTIASWLPVFTRPATVEVILDSWRYLQAHHDFRLHGYVILENHLHLVARSPGLQAAVHARMLGVRLRVRTRSEAASRRAAARRCRSATTVTCRLRGYGDFAVRRNRRGSSRSIRWPARNSSSFGWGLFEAGASYPYPRPVRTVESVERWWTSRAVTLASRGSSDSAIGCADLTSAVRVRPWRFADRAEALLRARDLIADWLGRERGLTLKDPVAPAAGQPAADGLPGLSDQPCRDWSWTQGIAPAAPPVTPGRRPGPRVPGAQSAGVSGHVGRAGRLIRSLHRGRRRCHCQ